jgi:hypothetical protein
LWLLTSYSYMLHGVTPSLKQLVALLVVINNAEGISMSTAQTRVSASSFGESRAVVSYCKSNHVVKHLCTVVLYSLSVVSSA